jgi:hypothetical protein
MPEFTVQFETVAGADAEKVAADVRSQLTELSGVEVVDSEVVKTRDPLLAAAAIWTVVKAAPQAIDVATKLIDSLTKLLQSTEGLHSAFVEIRGRRIPVSQLKPSDLDEPVNPDIQ